MGYAPLANTGLDEILDLAASFFFLVYMNNKSELSLSQFLSHLSLFVVPFSHGCKKVTLTFLYHLSVIAHLGVTTVSSRFGRMLRAGWRTYRSTGCSTAICTATTCSSPRNGEPRCAVFFLVLRTYFGELSLPLLLFFVNLYQYNTK